VDAGRMAPLEPGTAGTLAWLWLVVAAEFVFAGALGVFSTGGELLSGWRWQPTRIVAAKATAVRYGILFFMVR